MRTRRSPPSWISEMRPICSSLNWPVDARFEQHLGVDRVDDLHVARQQPLEQRHRPAFQRFGQQRVVGVGEGPLGDVPGLVEVDAVDVHQEPHQLGDGDRRMRVVQMDRRLVGQREQVAELAEMPLHDVLQRGGREEILLPQPQFLSSLVRIRRIKHARQRFRLVALAQRADVVAGVEGVEQDRIDRPSTTTVSAC